jgi:hypothetical protein
MRSMVDLSAVPAYSRPYFEKIGNRNAIDLMRANLPVFELFYRNIPAQKWDYAYAEGKWTIKQVLGHIIDSERVFQYRALCFSRNDQTDLPGFDQDVYVAADNASHRTPESLIDEYVHVRNAGLYLFENLSAEELLRSGLANGFNVQVNWIAYMITGHEMHHIEILKERYGIPNI